MRTLLWTVGTFLCAPVLASWSALRRSSSPPCIVIVQLGKLGDLLCTTPMFRAIKAAHPDWGIHVVCRAGSSEALSNNPHVTAVYHINRLSRVELIRQLRALRATAIINCLPGAFPSMLGLLALVPVRINTFSSFHGILVRLLRFLNTHNFRYMMRKSTHEYYVRLLSPLGIPPSDPVPEFRIPDSARRAMDAWRAERNLRDYVVCNITAGNTVKEWPEEKFAELIRRIRNELKLQVVLSTADTARAKSFLGRLIGLDGVIDVSGLTLPESAAIYARAAAFVSVDTGPLYVAYAQGVPLVIILGPVAPGEQLPRETASIAHVPPPPGCEPWMFVAQSPRTATPEQLWCRDTSVDAVFAALRRVCGT